MPPRPPLSEARPQTAKVEFLKVYYAAKVAYCSFCELFWIFGHKCGSFCALFVCGFGLGFDPANASTPRVALLTLGIRDTGRYAPLCRTRLGRSSRRRADLPPSAASRAAVQPPRRCDDSAAAITSEQKRIRMLGRGRRTRPKSERRATARRRFASDAPGRKRGQERYPATTHRTRISADRTEN